MFFFSKSKTIYEHISFLILLILLLTIISSTLSTLQSIKVRNGTKIKQKKGKNVQINKNALF